MCCRCIHLLREKHVCVWLGKKKSIKALFGHFKLYCISLNAFLSFLNKSFFSRVLLVKIRDWCMKNVHTFFLSNAENPVVMIQWKWTSALQNYLEKKKRQTSEKVPLTEMFLFSFSFIHRLKSQAFWCTEACTHFKCGFCFDILLLDS